MKVLVEQLGDGMESLLGKRVLLMCVAYFYVGKLIGVNDNCVKLEDASIVYETGPWTDAKYKDCQPLGMKTLYVCTGMIESYGESAK